VNELSLKERIELCQSLSLENFLYWDREKDGCKHENECIYEIKFTFDKQYVFVCKSYFRL
jgi:hypothetical protein